MDRLTKFNRCGFAALRRLWRDERGASAVEYGLLAALIALVIVSGARFLGNTLSTTFFSASSAIGGH